MTKFEIKTDHFEFRFGTHKGTIPSATPEQIFDWYMGLSANDPETRESFDTLEEAQEEFQKHYSNWGRTYPEASNVLWLLVGDVAWIEENTYDEDGEFDQGGDVYDISAEGYNVEYRVKPEYRDNWLAHGDSADEVIVSEEEIKRLAREWGMSVEDLMEQVEEI